MQRYFTDPYRFQPPYRSTFWGRLATPLMRPLLRRIMQVRQMEFRGVEHLRDSTSRGAGILLAPNHCRWADGTVLGMLGLAAGQFLYYVASYHMFRQSRWLTWWMRRMGCYSIHREGVDREALRASAGILANAERPLVIFPEGTWTRQNDRLGPLQEGLTLIARLAARQNDRPLLLHPVALKYWLLEDPRPVLSQRLGKLEARLLWSPQTQLDLLDRIERFSNALLALKEIEYLGQAWNGINSVLQVGNFDERRVHLVETLILEEENRHWGKPQEGKPMDRLRRLRQALVGSLAGLSPTGAEYQTIMRQLDRLLFCENITGHAQSYLCERPSIERLTEAVQRLEEIIDDKAEVPVVPLGVVIEVGPALSMRDFLEEKGRRNRGEEPMMVETASRIQGLLDGLLSSGPPPSWGCPHVALSEKK